MEVVSKCQTDLLWEHQQNVCIESLQGLSIPWPKPQNSIQPENWHKNLSQMSDIPISEAVRPSPGSGIVWCINRSPKEVRRVTRNTIDSIHHVRCEQDIPKGIFYSFFWKDLLRYIELGIVMVKALSRNNKWPILNINNDSLESDTLSVINMKSL